jgi:diadenosine tetraphosphate (Ap4A) HIT family hydrolase
MTQLAPEEAAEFFQEMMLAHRAIEEVMLPSKMNMCSLGNVVPHIHWHFFPRYKSDPNFQNPPWLQMQHFESAKISADSARELMEKLKASVNKLSSSVS